MKVSMVDSINHLEKTINGMVEVVKDMRSSEERAGDGVVQRSLSPKRSTNSAVNHGRVRTVPIKRKHHTSQVRKLRKNVSSIFGYSVGSTQPQKQGTLARGPSIPWRFQVSDHAL
ncbi:Uncharacterized protein Rs2_02670 [Raphanus sativus]|nr:Uncharacterized protein Rs2_02670 [Raphanus sativus]